jgi:hypothetical protein
MKQTAVEWLVEQICEDHTEQWQKEIEQAKEMEKEQIIKAHTNGWNKGIQNELITSQEYYNETFKQQEQ